MIVPDGARLEAKAAFFNLPLHTCQSIARHLGVENIGDSLCSVLVALARHFIPNVDDAGIAQVLFKRSLTYEEESFEELLQIGDVVEAFDEDEKKAMGQAVQKEKLFQQEKARFVSEYKVFRTKVRVVPARGGCGKGEYY